MKSSLDRENGMFCVTFGTRPEIIKMWSIVQACQKRGVSFFTLHTGQHYSRSLSASILRDLDYTEPTYNCLVGSGADSEETAKTMIGAGKVLLRNRPSLVLVEGDTNSVLGVALAAVKLEIPVAHVEAGLRCHDKTMPEEINRTLVDHCSDLLFAPTKYAAEMLRLEGISEGIHVTGNTVVDAVIHFRRHIRPKELPGGLQPGRYVLATLHRQENVDNRDAFDSILAGLRLVSSRFGIPVVYPVHPRAKKRIRTLKPDTRGIKLLPPLSFIKFLTLEANACLILTDSGGVQEEACTLKVPCVTLRSTTERPESILVGANMLAGSSPKDILRASEIMLGRSRKWRNPFGHGDAGMRIVEVAKRLYG